MNINIGLISLGCAKNLVDSEHMLHRVTNANMNIVEDIEKADIAIINTCGFIESAKQEAIENIFEVVNLKKQGKVRAIVVTGCLTERYKEEFMKDIPEVDAILGTGSYTDIVEAVEHVLQGKKFSKFGDINKNHAIDERIISTPAHYAYLKIAEGCDNHCAYCVIPSLRGKYRSRTMEDILAEARELSKMGVKELIIIAQDITRYGTDLYGKRRLSELCDELCELDFKWIRLHYLYPDEIDDTLIDTIAKQDKILNYLDIPIQHVSSSMIKRMNRRGDKDYLTGLFAKLREKIPNLVLRTSLIAGMPGETEEEFTELCTFLRDTKIERVGIFPFSREEGSEAYDMPNQVEEHIRDKRVQIAEEIQSRVMDAYNDSLAGKTFTVLCEGYDEEYDEYYGRTYSHSPDIDGRVCFDSEYKITVGDFVQVYIEDYDGTDLLGTVE